MALFQFLFYVSFLFCSVAYAATPSSAPMEIRTEDGTVITWPYQLRVSNGALTDNGDGTSSLATGGGSSQWSGTAGNPIYYTGGNVGVGTSTTRAKLDVEGTVYMKGNVGVGTLSPRGALDVADGFIYGNGSALSVGNSLQLEGHGASYFQTALGYTPANIVDLALYQPSLGYTPANIVDLALYQPKLSYTPANLVDLALYAPLSGANFTGNLGLGSSSPQQKLDVEGSIYVGAGGNVGIGTQTTRQSLDVDGTVYMKGNVGVGTTAPKEILEVEGAVYLASHVPPSTAWRLYNNGGTLQWNGADIGGGAASGWTTDSSSKTTTTYNVGVGTTAPRQTLDVEGTVYMKGNVGINTTNPVYGLDVESSIYGKGLYDSGLLVGSLKISDSSPSSAASLTISNLSTGIYLLLVDIVQNTGNSYCYFTINGDGGSNYLGHAFYFQEGTLGGSIGTSTNIPLPQQTTGVNKLLLGYGIISASGNNVQMLWNYGTYSSDASKWLGGTKYLLYSGSAPLSSLTITNNAQTFTGTVRMYKYR